MAWAWNWPVLRRGCRHGLLRRRLTWNRNGLSGPERARIGQVVRRKNLLLRQAMSACDGPNGFASLHRVALAACALGDLCPGRHRRLSILRRRSGCRDHKHGAGHDRATTKPVRARDRLDSHAVPLGERKNRFARRKPDHFSARRICNGRAGGPRPSPAVHGRCVPLIRSVIRIVLRRPIVAFRRAIISAALLLVLRLLFVAIRPTSLILRGRRRRVAARTAAVIALGLWAVIIGGWSVGRWWRRRRRCIAILAAVGRVDARPRVGPIGKRGRAVGAIAVCRLHSGRRGRLLLNRGKVNPGNLQISARLVGGSARQLIAALRLRLRTRCYSNGVVLGSVDGSR